MPQSPSPVRVERSISGFSGQPSIAVLPFQTVSDPTVGEVLAHGMAEELIARLSAWREYPILASGSTARYSPLTTVDELRHDLHAGYVARGVLRRNQDRVRVSMQLIDAESARIVWNQQYDEPMRDLFELQDRIADAITSSLEPQLRRAEMHRVAVRSPANFNAWECIQRGQMHLLKLSREDFEQAESLFRRALALDPDYATAHAYLGIALGTQALYGFARSPKRLIQEGLDAASTALAIDDQNPIVHRAFGALHLQRGELDASIEANLRSVQLNPSYALGYWGAGQQLALAGRSTEALAMLHTAMRLSPHDPCKVHFLSDLAIAYFAAERYEDCIQSAVHSLQLVRKSNWCWPFLIAGLVQQDRMVEAQAELRRADEAMPHFTPEIFGRTLLRIGTQPELIARLDLSLRAAASR